MQYSLYTIAEPWSLLELLMFAGLVCVEQKERKIGLQSRANIKDKNETKAKKS